MGGGTDYPDRDSLAGKGLSPRGRGNPVDAGPEHEFSGSIPAWAGEPRRPATRDRAPAVYPRVGGGTAWGLALGDADDGLSPRGRGNPRTPGPSELWIGSIPAWAGEPLPGGVRVDAIEVYPRVGGGTILAIPGSRPGGGLSPRGRGNRSACTGNGGRVRSIPAWAGEPPRIPPSHGVDRVYPRVGGGTSGPERMAPRHRGLSPRGRGNSASCSEGRQIEGSIPAWAGEPPHARAVRALDRVYPRVGGGTVPTRIVVSAENGLSPRGRGNQSPDPWSGGRRGSIPAWAGEPAGVTRAGAVPRVYPRVGGGTRRETRRRRCVAGLSPRGRGNLRRAAVFPE